MQNATDNPTSLYEQKIHPYKQAIGGVCMVIFLLLMGGMMTAMGLELPERFAWMAAGAAIMIYAMFNSVLALSAQNANKYWGQSITAYVGLVVVGSLIAWAASGESINEAGSFRWIYTVLTFGYLVFITMMNAMKNIVAFAQREEWNQPRLRTKNRKKRKL